MEIVEEYIVLYIHVIKNGPDSYVEKDWVKVYRTKQNFLFRQYKLDNSMVQISIEEFEKMQKNTSEYLLK